MPRINMFVGSVLFEFVIHLNVDRENSRTNNIVKATYSKTRITAGFEANVKYRVANRKLTSCKIQ